MNLLFLLKRFSQDILQMTGHMPGLYWQITWRFVGPVLISVLLVASIIYRSFDKPVYSAWKAELVSRARFVRFTDSFHETDPIISGPLVMLVETLLI